MNLPAELTRSGQDAESGELGFGSGGGGVEGLQEDGSGAAGILLDEQTEVSEGEFDEIKLNITPSTKASKAFARPKFTIPPKNLRFWNIEIGKYFVSTICEKKT